MDPLVVAPATTLRALSHSPLYSPRLPTVDVTRYVQGVGTPPPPSLGEDRPVYKPMTTIHLPNKHPHHQPEQEWRATREPLCTPYPGFSSHD